MLFLPLMEVFKYVDFLLSEFLCVKFLWMIHFVKNNFNCLNIEKCRRWFEKKSSKFAWYYADFIKRTWTLRSRHSWAHCMCEEIFFKGFFLSWPSLTMSFLYWKDSFTWNSFFIQKESKWKMIRRHDYLFLILYMLLLRHRSYLYWSESSLTINQSINWIALDRPAYQVSIIFFYV